MELEYYETRSEAKKAIDSLELDCKGTHKNKGKYGPCATKKKYEDISSKEDNGELEELVDFDGTPLSSKIPILDPRTTSKGGNTMDKTVAGTRITQDPLMRGYRVYYGESVVREEDMADAFGYDETKFMDADETIDYFVDELDFDQRDGSWSSSTPSSCSPTTSCSLSSVSRSSC